MWLEINPPLEVILARMKGRIDILERSTQGIDITLIYLKKDFEDLERCLKDKIII